MSKRTELTAERRKVLGVLSASVAYDRFIDICEQELEALREQYESQEASEFLRGQVMRQRKLIQTLKARGA